MSDPEGRVPAGEQVNRRAKTYVDVKKVFHEISIYSYIFSILLYRTIDELAKLRVRCGTYKIPRRHGCVAAIEVADDVCVQPSSFLETKAVTSRFGACLI